jgi:hypothetical protein
MKNAFASSGSSPGLGLPRASPRRGPQHYPARPDSNFDFTFKKSFCQGERMPWRKYRHDKIFAAPTRALSCAAR